jgi:BASS family bile acid:Na+ symporter
MKKSFLLFLSIIFGLFFTQAAKFSFLIYYLLMVMLFFPLLDCKIPFKIFKEKRIYVLLCANIFIGLSGYFLLKDYDQNLAFCAFLIGVTPTATACPAVMGFLKGKVEFAFAAVIVTNIFMSFFLPLAIYSISDQPIEVHSIFFKTLSVIFIPLIVGKAIKRLFPKIRGILIKHKNIGFYSWLGVCFLAVSKASSYIQDSSASSNDIILIACISGILCCVNFSAGRWLGGEHYSLEMSQTLGQKNTTLTIWIGLTYLSPLIALGPIFYLIYHNLFNSFQLAVRGSRKQSAFHPKTLACDKFTWIIPDKDDIEGFNTGLGHFKLQSVPGKAWMLRSSSSYRNRRRGGGMIKNNLKGVFSVCKGFIAEAPRAVSAKFSWHLRQRKDPHT